MTDNVHHQPKVDSLRIQTTQQMSIIHNAQLSQAKCDYRPFWVFAAPMVV